MLTAAEKSEIERMQTISQTMYRQYGKTYADYMLTYKDQSRIYNLGGKGQLIFWQRRWQHMLNFKDASGEIVMSEKDNGKLVIHDEALKHSLENKVSLQEAKLAQADQADNGR